MPPKLRYIFAKCCFDLSKMEDCQNALFVNKNLPEEKVREFLSKIKLETGKVSARQAATPAKTVFRQMSLELHKVQEIEAKMEVLSSDTENVHMPRELEDPQFLQQIEQLELFQRHIQLVLQPEILTWQKC
ncbi:unnamed protein product [Caenorhabditis angaria]|uniref:Uncharacterized protein n=1 Tax=Caenorhabditis angaria TaxID=860376 RepID=A0A9P1MX84_9PELO|nr:unnamed protein product [Caenorhabditis angaria]